MTTGEIITLLQARGFRFTHSLGQNFLIDDEMLEEIVRAARRDAMCWKSAQERAA